MQRILGSILALFVATPAFAHAHLVKSSPAENASLPAAPTAIVIEFSEAIEPHFSMIEVETEKGARVDRADVHNDAGNPKTLSVTLVPLAPGTYKVKWNATSTDTHKTNGSYEFKVAP